MLETYKLNVETYCILISLNRLCNYMNIAKYIGIHTTKSQGGTDHFDIVVYAHKITQ